MEINAFIPVAALYRVLLFSTVCYDEITNPARPVPAAGGSVPPTVICLGGKKIIVESRSFILINTLDASRK